MSTHVELAAQDARESLPLPPADDLDAFDVIDATTGRKRRLNIIRVLSVIVVIGGWQLAGPLFNPLFMSYPSKIFMAAVQLASTGELWAASAESFKTLILGFILASIVGVVLGLIIGRYREAEAATGWIVNALYATPLVALIPLVILWFGLGFNAKFFVVFLLAIFPVLINTATGVRNVSGSLVDVAVAFAANERQIFTKIILPGSLPYIMAGLRLGVGRAIIGMVTAEFLTAMTGLGGMVEKYGNAFRTDAMFVPIIILMILGVTLATVLLRAEALIAPWKVSIRE